jgi:hypothetical protein
MMSAAWPFTLARAWRRSGEVLVSSTVKDLVAGSGLNRGSHLLKGVPGEWRIFVIER